MPTSKTARNRRQSQKPSPTTPKTSHVSLITDTVYDRPNFTAELNAIGFIHSYVLLYLLKRLIFDLDVLYVWVMTIAVVGFKVKVIESTVNTRSAGTPIRTVLVIQFIY